MKLFWVIALIGSVFGGFAILITLAASKTAPQEAAGFAMACALAVVPYVFARAVQAMRAPNLSEEVKKIISAIESGQKP